MTHYALEVESVTRTEKGVQEPLLSALSLNVKEGQLVALVGADGAGKTTLMRTLAGLLKPQKGTVKVFGENLYENLSELQNLCGYMPQKFGLYQDLSVVENLSLYADLFNLNSAERERRFKELLEMTDLTAFTDRLAGRLSGGMKQKLGLACALLNHPKLLLLDEPSVGVDPLSRQELWRILQRNVRQESMTIVVATTYMDEASLCDEVIVLENGHLVLMDTPQNIAQKAQGLTYFVEPAKNERSRDLQAFLLDNDEWVLDAVPQAGYVRVLLRPNRTLEDFRGQIGNHTCLSVEARLEDGYLVERYRNEPRQTYSVIKEQTQESKKKCHEALITARDLVRRFGNFEAVKKTSFDVYRGEIFGLLGPNGAGKTTTFKMLCGLLTVSDGELSIDGFDVNEALQHVKSNLGYMSQKFALYGDLSVRENMNFFANAYGLFGQVAKRRIELLIEEFQLKEYQDHQSKTLPGGVKQRLAMAVALLHKPKILFLDEPTSGADVPTRRQFWRWMTALSAAGTTIIVTTHFMEEAQYCDRMLIQDRGEALILGTPEEIRQNSPTMDEAFIRVVKQFRTEGEK